MRAVLAVAVVAGFGLWSTARHLAEAARPDPGYRVPGWVAFYDGGRFEAVAADLPPGEAVGYAEDDPPGGDEMPTYFLAQYALAPHVLVRDRARRLLLVNGRADRLPAAAAGRRLLRDGGGGVRLYAAGEGP